MTVRGRNGVREEGESTREAAQAASTSQTYIASHRFKSAAIISTFNQTRSCCSAAGAPQSRLHMWHQPEGGWNASIQGLHVSVRR